MESVAGRPSPSVTAGARVLYLTKVLPYPPAVAGDAAYSRGIIEAWSTVADLTVVCADGGGDPSVGAEAVTWIVTRPQRISRAGSILSRFPLIAWKGAAPDYRVQLNKLLERPDWDVIVLDNIGLAHALPRAETYRARNPRVRIVYVSHEHEYRARTAKYASYRMNPVKNLFAKLDLLKVRRWENALVARTDTVTVINLSDLDHFRAIDASRKFLPILPGYSGSIAPPRTITDKVPRRVLILGGRRSEQKQQVLLDWLTASYDSVTVAAIEMMVVGDMSNDLRSQIQRSFPAVRVLGFTDNLDEVIAQARAGLIVDTVGGGFKLRLLSHVFHRLPIVGLSDAIDGLPTPEGEGYLAAPSLEELVRLVCEVVDDLDRLNAVHERAFADCESAFSWSHRAQILSALVEPNASEFLV